MTLRFLSVDSVRALHTAIIEDSGGSPGLRDAGLLESAVLRAVNRANYDPDAGIPELAASFSFGLIKNHAFIDGNKRIGFAALLEFLDLNGYVLVCTKPEMIRAVLAVAAGDMDESTWTSWVESVTRPLP